MMADSSRYWTRAIHQNFTEWFDRSYPGKKWGVDYVHRRELNATQAKVAEMECV
jgi:hypothetical protein